jgi:protein-S-isoprenylcysteine O-methyltransferase Ste14
MLWLPVFKIGWWNAWLLMLFVLVHPIMMLLVDRVVGTGGLLKKMGETPNDKTENRISNSATLLLYFMVVLSIAVPLKVNSAWLYAGLAVYLAGVLIFLIAIVNASTTPPGKIFSQGMYHYSRHPLYLAFILILMGVSIAGASWVFLILSAIYSNLMAWQAQAEERTCLNCFGNVYRIYMNKTPRWAGIPRIR